MNEGIRHRAARLGAAPALRVATDHHAAGSGATFRLGPGFDTGGERPHLGLTFQNGSAVIANICLLADADHLLSVGVCTKRGSAEFVREHSGAKDSGPLCRNGSERLHQAR